jgi:hypothetical protein
MKQVKSKGAYNTGMRFSLRNYGCTEKYILAQVGNYECALINLTDGNRWHEPYKVKDVRAIMPSELDEILGVEDNKTLTWKQVKK